MRLETFALASAPTSLREWFDAVGHSESSWVWFETLAQTTLGPGEEAWIAALIEDDGAILAAIPLVRSDARQTRGLTAPYTTLFQPPLGQCDQALALGQLLTRQIRGVLRLDCLNAADPTVEAFFEGLTKGGLLVARYQHFANWFEEISDFSKFWASRASRLKSTIKRKTSALLRDHQLAFHQIDLTADWQSGVAIYEAIYATSWKAAEPAPDFIGTLLNRLGSVGTARLAIATIDSEPAAAQIWLVQAPRATIFKLAHDPKFDHHSPGSLLTHWFLKELCEKDGVREVDFGRGDDAYKRDWLHNCRFRSGAIAANSRTLTGLRAAFFEVAPTKVSTFIRAKIEKSTSSKSER